jgi:hypothetical protein
MFEEPIEFVFSDHVSVTLRHGIVDELIQIGAVVSRKDENGFVILDIKAKQLEYVKEFLLQEELSGALYQPEPT